MSVAWIWCMRTGIASRRKADVSVLRVEVVAAEGIAWEGDALSVIARTTEGDIGVLPNHEPLLAALVPCAAEVLTTDGNREVVAIDGGFISVADNRSRC